MADISNVQGFGGVLETDPEGGASPVGLSGMAVAPVVSAVGSMRTYFDLGTLKWKVSESGAAYVDVIGGGAAIVGLGGTCYVSTAGNDGTAVRGNMALPFLTVQAALNAALSGDTVYIGPGTFTENISIPTLDVLSIIGSGIGSTVLTDAVGLTLDYTATGQARQLYVARLSIVNTSGNTALNLNANANADFARNGFTFDSVQIEAGTSIVAAEKGGDDITFRHCKFTGGGVFSLKNISLSLCVGCVFTDAVTVNVSFDDSQFFTALGRVRNDFKACIMSALKIDGHPVVILDRACWVRDFVSAIGLTESATPLGPQITIAARIGDELVNPASGAVQIILPPVTFAAVNIVDFSWADFQGTSGVVFINGPAVFTVKAFNSTWRRKPPGAVQIIDGAGFQFILDIRGASWFAQNIFAVVAAGCLARTTWNVLATPNPGGIFGIAFLPFPDAFYAVAVEANFFAAIASAVVAKAPGGIQLVTAAAGGTVDLTLTWLPP